MSLSGINAAMCELRDQLAYARHKVSTLEATLIARDSTIAAIEAENKRLREALERISTFANEQIPVNAPSSYWHERMKDVRVISLRALADAQGEGKER